MIDIRLADQQNGLQWCQEQVKQYHYLHKPVDVRSSPVAYIVTLDNRRVGCLIFGRPEATRVNGWYGSVEDTLTHKCRITRWQILNLARIWLHPDIQSGGACYIKNAATRVIAKSLQSIVYDYLVVRPPVWMEEPYEIAEVLSYCDKTIHQGTLYRASNFHLMRTNERGIETYAMPVRRLTHAEKRTISELSWHSKRCQRLRAARTQMTLWESVEGAS